MAIFKLMILIEIYKIKLQNNNFDSINQINQFKQTK